MWNVQFGYYLEAIANQTIIVSSISTVNAWTAIMGIQIANKAIMGGDYGP